MDKIKRMILLHVPTSICNFRCSYCYLAQRKVKYQGVQPKMKYSPEHVAKALSPERMGGICYINSCAEGETLLTNNIDLYYKALVEQGHYLEIVTNLTVTPMIDKILQWDAELLKRVEFKASFHYLELKRKKMLDVFASNAKKIWKSGASVNIEITPSDELIPYINEVKEFSMREFGALPHLSIARNDATRDIEKLTNLSEEEYAATWESFDSGFWQYKQTVFGKKQNGFCYAGLWQINVNLSDGFTKACYFRTEKRDNIFETPDKPYKFKPIGRCPIAHCYNAHMLLTFGLIPGATEVCYGNIRNRVRDDGTEWLQPELKAFFNSKLIESNEKWSTSKEKRYLFCKKNKRRYVKLRKKVRNAIKKPDVKKA